MFKDHYTVTDMGVAKEFLGVRITQGDRYTDLDKELYCGRVSKKYKAYIGSRNYTDAPLARDSNLMHQEYELALTQAVPGVLPLSCSTISNCSNPRRYSVCTGSANQAHGNRCPNMWCSWQVGR